MMCTSPSSYFFLLGLGGAVGYMLGGLDWTGTLLGSVFKSQEQVLFIFAALIFSVSVVLHLFSIPEQPQDFVQAAATAGGDGDEDSASRLSLRPNGNALPYIDVIIEEEDSRHDHDRGDAEQDNNMDFFSVERARSKSDSVLAMPEATIKLDPDLHPDSHHFLPAAEPILSETLGELDGAFAPSDCPFVCSPLLPCSTVPPPGVMVDLQPVSHSLTPTSDNYRDSLNKKVQFTFITIIEAFLTFGRALFHNNDLVFGVYRNVFSASKFFSYLFQCQPKTVNGVKQGASTAHSPPANRSAPTKSGTRLGNTPNPPRPHPPTFYRQVWFHTV